MGLHSGAEPIVGGREKGPSLAGNKGRESPWGPRRDRNQAEAYLEAGPFR